MAKQEIKTNDKIRCSICNSNKTYNRRRKSGNIYPRWYFIENKIMCRSCWQKINEGYKKSHNKGQIKYYLKNPKKVKAHRIVNNKKLRGNQCERCGIKNVRLEAHHFDYSKPNKIITLCVKCHKEIHR